MAKAHSPRHGSMQFWHRRRANKPTARVRSWNLSKGVKDVRPLGFIGYKAGMTHALVVDNRPTSKSKGKEIFCPLTVLECPPVKIFSVRFYKTIPPLNNLKLVSEVLNKKLEKDLSRKVTLPKAENMEKHNLDSVKPETFDSIRILVYAQPRQTGLGKKTPEMIELGLSGKKEEQLAYVKSKLDSEIKVQDVLTEGQQVDIHGVTKGKGFCGAVKRFGIALKPHKSEKNRRNPGSLGGWSAQGHVMYRVAHAGQMGFHQRIHLNSQIMKIAHSPEEINPKGGFIRYGIVKGTYLLMSGSVPGAKKRLVTMTFAYRPSKKITKAPAPMTYISLASKQGR